MTGSEGHLLDHVPRARRTRGRGLMAVAAVAAVLVPAAVAVPSALADGGADRQGARAWAGIFDALRPVPSLDPRRVVVVFDAPSLADWQTAADGELNANEQRAFVRKARLVQDRQLVAMRKAGMQFSVQHRYVRALNGVSLVLHGDDAQRLSVLDGVRSVSRVRAVYPARYDWASGSANDTLKRLSSRIQPRPAAAQHDAAGTASATVAVLDTGIDVNHPALAGRQAGPGYDVLARTNGVEPGDDDAHGTEMAGGVMLGAGNAAVRILPVRVVGMMPVLGGREAVVGTSDALLAGFELAVDPDRDGAVTDAADVALAALSVPYAGFADAPEERAIRGALALGTLTVAAAGNDGSSGDPTGTVGGPAAARDAIAVGAADMRHSAARVDVHARGGLLDAAWSSVPLLTTGSELPASELPVVPISGSGADVVDYLGEDARSRVGGAIVLVDRHDGVSLASQVRAAADAGAAAVLVAGADAHQLAGAVTAAGADIPAVGIPMAGGADMRAAAAESRVEVDLRLQQGATNDAFGRVAGFSSRGPRYDGIGKPDVLAPGVGVQTTGAARRDAGAVAYTTVNGTSIAAAQVAGQVAALRAAHPGWTPQRLRAALLGTARPLGDGAREPIEAQGAGMVDLAAAEAAEVVASPSRVDFGIVTPGASARSKLAFVRIRTGAALPLPQLGSERSGAEDGPLPSVDGERLVIQVPEGTASGVYGGWLVNARDGVRVPWMVVVRQPDEFGVPLTATISDASFGAIGSPGQFPSSVQIAVGGSSSEGSLGLRAAQGLELDLHTGKGKKIATVGRLEYVLPGVYTMGLTGRAGDGTALAPGSYALRTRVRSASTPRGTWVQGPEVRFSIER